MKSYFFRVFALLCVGAGVLPASTFSFQGNFTADDQVQLFGFSILFDSTVDLISWGSGGGTNGAGSVIPTGGFDTNFTLFDSLGNQIATNDDSCAGPPKTNGACSDAYIQSFLTVGTYSLALTQTGNPSAGNLSDGFVQQGNGNYTANSGCTAFCDSLGNALTGHWAVDIVNVQTANQVNAVPEPFSAGLAGGGLLCLVVLRFKRLRASQR